jgi:hypothetical protein
MNINKSLPVPPSPKKPVTARLGMNPSTIQSTGSTGCGEGPLFYSETVPLKAKDDDLTNPRRPRSVKTRERIAQWVRELGVTDKWRHTFKRKAARAGIEAGTRDAICGRSPRSVADQYETPTVADMAEALKKFPRYDLVLEEG